MKAIWHIPKWESGWCAEYCQHLSNAAQRRNVTFQVCLPPESRDWPLSAVVRYLAVQGPPPPDTALLLGFPDDLVSDSEFLAWLAGATFAGVVVHIHNDLPGLGDWFSPFARSWLSIVQVAPSMILHNTVEGAETFDRSWERLFGSSREHRTAVTGFPYLADVLPLKPPRKTIDVLWAGRDTLVKNFPAAYAMLRRLSDIGLSVAVSFAESSLSHDTELAVRGLDELHIPVAIGDPRKYDQLLSQSHVWLSTSLSETLCLTCARALFRDFCIPVVPDIPVFRHYLPHQLLYPQGSIVGAVETVQRVLRPQFSLRDCLYTGGHLRPQVLHYKSLVNAASASTGIIESCLNSRR